MEKLSVIKPDLTPEMAPVKTADCTSSGIVDNKERKKQIVIEELNADFRKQAADCVADRLNK
jgi:hypothetical protein